MTTQAIIKTSEFKVFVEIKDGKVEVIINDMTMCTGGISVIAKYCNEHRDTLRVGTDALLRTSAPEIMNMEG